MFLAGNYADAVKKYEEAIALMPGKSSLIYKKQRALERIPDRSANDSELQRAKQAEEERVNRERQLARQREQDEVAKKRQLEQKISELLIEGDDHLKRNNFTQALASYKIASALNPEARIPKDKIEQARQLEARHNSQNQTGTANNPTNSGQPLPNNIYTLVEEMPTFQGGNTARMKYLAENLRYPSQARNAGVQGTVRVSFIIDEQGRPGSISIINPLGHGCDEEAVRLVRQMPAWNPGKQQGKLVKVKMEMNIPFSL